MRAIHSRLSRLSMAAASVVLLSAGPGLGQNMPVPCSAFARTAHGGWKVLAPTMLYIEGKPLGPTVGSTLPAGSMPNGINLSEALDRVCGNRVIWPAVAGDDGRQGQQRRGSQP
jgi:hypothetical protein